VTTPGTGTNPIPLLHGPQRGESDAPPGLGYGVWGLGPGACATRLSSGVPAGTANSPVVSANSIRVDSCSFAVGIFKTEGLNRECARMAAHSALCVFLCSFVANPALEKSARGLCTLHGFLSHSGFRSASDPTSQPDVTAINRSAARYTCYVLRDDPGCVS
jgi:hypothetical protein